jgi:hypothetical protein
MIFIDVRGTGGYQSNLDQGATPEAPLGAALNIAVCPWHLGCDACGLGG